MQSMIYDTMSEKKEALPVETAATPAEEREEQRAKKESSSNSSRELQPD
jgi:hypothetical protein